MPGKNSQDVGKPVSLGEELIWVCKQFDLFNPIFFVAENSLGNDGPRDGELGSLNNPKVLFQDWFTSDEGQLRRSTREYTR